MIKIYDTTLRDGTQGEDVSLTVEDKLRIAQRLDALGVHYVEGGWPGSNPRDIQFFREARGLTLEQAKLCAFGSTCRVDVEPDDDANIQALVEAGTPVVTIVGKSWDLHVEDVLRTTLSKNLEIIEKSLSYLKHQGLEVIYDAEHFFDGYKANPEYALDTLRAAVAGGADVLVLCDTNGGSLPQEIHRIVGAVKELVTAPLGIHCHNDSDLAVANSLAAVAAGATHVQGTMNGYGERCGNANLVSILPNLILKMGRSCIPMDRLKKLREVSRFVDELANLQHNKHQPFVGDSAFAHKGGIHVSAVRRNPLSYEHIEPGLVGNDQRILVSDLSGRANVIAKARELGIELDEGSHLAGEVLERMKRLESEGYQYEGAEASFEILVKKSIGRYRKFFDLVGFRVIDEKRTEGEEPIAEATIMVRVDGEVEHTAAIGNGPVNALDAALRKALETFYPAIRDVRLVDFKVRVLSGAVGTAARVRVLIESTDGVDSWGTVGVSENIIQASWESLVDSIEYKLLRDEEKSPDRLPAGRPER
ncbi:MAG: citramalate synthase [Deltaproteobacteria bacterium]|nr:citramalate synthase [Deltaproteobacteria bacterium]